jgi:hypothetical protein
MPATVTLSETTLAASVGSSARQVKVTSTSGLTPGLQLFLDGELMEVVSLGIDPWVNVLRGRGGTAAVAHDSGVTIYSGRADQFYDSDPVGAPENAIPVSPYINVRDGNVWFALGDTLPGENARRWWQKQTISFDDGALGVRVRTADPTAST